ncbi:hypothetical protein DMUE_2164 [Dictyocoela muelleri]|nr:hypothetical protein DMUE_2164 [Dictyocoela muelleri]
MSEQQEENGNNSGMTKKIMFAIIGAIIIIAIISVGIILWKKGSKKGDSAEAPKLRVPSNVVAPNHVYSSFKDDQASINASSAKEKKKEDDENEKGNKDEEKTPKKSKLNSSSRVINSSNY